MKITYISSATSKKANAAAIKYAHHHFRMWANSLCLKLRVGDDS